MVLRTQHNLSHTGLRITDAQIHQITQEALGRWPSFEAQSWACKVVHAVIAATPHPPPSAAPTDNTVLVEAVKALPFDYFPWPKDGDSVQALISRDGVIAALTSRPADPVPALREQFDRGWKFGEHSARDESASTITTLQTRLTEVEAQLSVSVGHRKAQSMVIDRLRGERDAALSREKEWQNKYNFALLFCKFN